MASRYDREKINQLNDGRRVYGSKRYPNIPKSNDDIYVITQGGDRLDTLANDYYSDSSLWWIIATANNIHDASFAVPDGTELRIPSNYQKIILDFNK